MAEVPISQLANYTKPVTDPIIFEFLNLHPVTAVGQAAQQIGMIYLVTFAFNWMIATFPLMLAFNSNMDCPIARSIFLLSCGLFATFCLSLFYSSVVAMYDSVRSDNFVPYWMLNWLQQVCGC